MHSQKWVMDIQDVEVGVFLALFLPSLSAVCLFVYFVFASLFNTNRQYLRVWEIELLGFNYRLKNKSMTF